MKETVHLHLLPSLVTMSTVTEEESSVGARRSIASSPARASVPSHRGQRSLYQTERGVESLEVRLLQRSKSTEPNERGVVDPMRLLLQAFSQLLSFRRGGAGTVHCYQCIDV